jgi:cell division protein FtsZ
MKFNIPTQNTSIIKVIGVGGGGGNAVAHMYTQGIVGVDFAICNTDEQAMENSPIDLKIPLGPSLTEGRGAGSRPETGKEACIESIDEIRTFLLDGTKMLFVTAGMGGGTGTGAAPIIAKAAREQGILTVGIVTLPFQFEGMRRKRQALEGLDNLKKNVDAILVISNDKLEEMYGDLSISDAFNQADNILTTAAKSIAEIITVPGKVNVDFEDVNFVMKDSGVALMGYGIADGPNRAKDAVMMALSSPLLEDNDIKGARSLLLNISSGSKEITMSEIGQITKIVQEEAGYGTDLIWGNCSDPALGEKVTVTLIATGFETGIKKQSTIAKTAVVDIPLEDEFEFITGATSESEVFEVGGDAMVIEFEDLPQPKMDASSKSAISLEDQQKIELERVRRTYQRLNNLLPLDSAENKDTVEKIPAYLRREMKMDEDEIPSPIAKGKICASYYVDSEGSVTKTNRSYTTTVID